MSPLLRISIKMRALCTYNNSDSADAYDSYVEIRHIARAS
jgi:hypothetical protein